MRSKPPHLKPIADRITDRFGRIQVLVLMRPETMDLVQRTQRAVSFAGTQADFLEVLLQQGAKSLAREHIAAKQAEERPS